LKKEKKGKEKEASLEKDKHNGRGCDGVRAFFTSHFRGMRSDAELPQLTWCPALEDRGKGEKWWVRRWVKRGLNNRKLKTVV